jgi:hypothetical protein
MALQAQLELRPLLAALLDAAGVQLLREPQVVKAAQQGPQVSQPLPEQSWDAQQVWASAAPEPGLARQMAPRALQVSAAEPLRWAAAEPLVAPRDAAAEGQPQLPFSA